VTGGLSVQAGGLNVADGTLTTAGTDNTAAINVVGGLTTSTLGITAGGLTVTGGASATGGVTIIDEGIPVLKGGATILDGGMLVTDGGVTITAGGLMVSGADNGGAGKGLTITAGDLVITNDLYINQETLYYSGTYTVTSDRRLKTDIEALGAEESLEKVKALRGVYFYWDQAVAHIRSTTRQVGLIAQDVQAVLPEAVKQMANKPFLGVTYEAVLPLLVEALHALREKFVSLTMSNSISSKNGKVKPQENKKERKSKRQLLIDIEELRSLLDGAEERSAALETLVASNTG
jgi:hypothetical protein